MFGRCIRVGLHRGDPGAAVYVVAESDPAKALNILRTELPDNGSDFEDVGRVTQQLVDALDLKPGQFRRT